MSLLLLFPGEPTAVATFSCWSAVASTPLSWDEYHYAFAHHWSDWSTLTWGQIASSGLTWEQLAGMTFTVATSTPTTWSVVTVNTCGAV